MGKTSTVTPDLSTEQRESVSHEGERLRLRAYIRRENNYSPSPGERAGVRASVISDCILKLDLI